MKKADHRKRPSLTRVLVFSEVFFFVMLLLVWASSLWVIGSFQESQFLQEQRSVIDRAVIDVRSRMGHHKQILRELFASTLEKPELFRNEQQRQYFGKNATLSEIDRIQTYNEGIGYLFVLRENDFMVGSRSPRAGSSFALRSWIEEMLLSGSLEENISSWRSVRIEGKPYLYLVLYDQMRLLYVGNLIAVDELFSDFSDSVYYPHYFALYDGENLLYEEGADQDVSGYTYQESLGDDLTLSGQVELTTVSLLEFAPLSILILGLFCLAAFALQSRFLHLRFALPMKNLSLKVSQAKAEPGKIRIEPEESSEEIYQLSSGLAEMMDEVVVRRFNDYQHQIDDQRRELLRLRSQLRPHFYLNALTTIDAMTYQNRNEDIRRFLAALSVHVRYMLRTDESHITLEEEIRHIEAYMELQEIRHPGKIVHLFSVPDELGDLEIPHLVIYTILENSFKYAFGAEDTLLIMIQAKKTEEGVEIRIEDNGPGYPEEMIREIESGAVKENRERERPRIGLHNVRRTMALWYGREDLLKIHNSHMKGAVTELLFPFEKEERSSSAQSVV